MLAKLFSMRSGNLGSADQCPSAAAIDWEHFKFYFKFEYLGRRLKSVRMGGDSNPGAFSVSTRCPSVYDESLCHPSVVGGCQL